MINSKKIEDLRPDVLSNVRVFISMMAERGYKVAFSSTLRDDEKQAQLYAQGRTAPGQIVTYSRVTTFHGKGLAFDIYQDAPTFAKQWQDTGFWKIARELQTLIGFSKISGEESHSEWSDGKKYTGTQVRAGILPPNMPPYAAQVAQTAPTLTGLLRIGSKGESVGALQSRLNAFGYKLAVDGDFGPKTGAAVEHFQEAHGLASDGIVGPLTWKALFE